MAAGTVQDEVDRIPWFHRIDLGNGIVTPGVDNSQRKLRRLHLPDRLDGKSVLDIGAVDGFFAFEAERRGAARVLATDSYAWSAEGWKDKRGFDLAKRCLASRVEEQMVDVMDLTPESIGTFDVTLFLGVLYHLKHPLLALEKVAAVTRGMAIVETVVDVLSVRRPAMAFYPNDELSNDPTNWWAPNVPGLLGMLRVAGFARVDVVAGLRPLPVRWARAAKLQVGRASAARNVARTDRVVVHAWK